MLSASRSRPLQLDGPIDDWGLENTNSDNIDAVGRVYRAQAFIENEEQDRLYILRGVDEDFTEHGGLPCTFGIHHSVVHPKKHGCRCTAAVTLSLSMLLRIGIFLDGTSVGVFSVKVGENITIIDAQQPSHRREVMVVAFSNNPRICSLQVFGCLQSL